MLGIPYLIILPRPKDIEYDFNKVFRKNLPIK